MSAPVPGPPLAALVHRLAETPEDFLGEPNREVDVATVVSDLVHALGGEFLDEAAARAFATEPRRLTVALVAAWLLFDPWFRARGGLAAPARDLLSRGFADLAAVVEPRRFVSDPDRREELARLVLRALGLLPEGETDAQAADRLTTLSSTERVKVLKETRAAQERIRAIQEAMRKKAAEEAASAYGRE